MEIRVVPVYGTWIILFILVCSLFIPVYTLATAGVNAQIPFAGVLKDSNGLLLTGIQDMVFTIYDAENGGNVLWTGSYTSDNGNPVVITDGAFQVMLGSGTGNALTLDFNDDTYYLGVTVGDDPEMVPRERLGASGYAINSDMLDGLHASSFLQSSLPIALSLESTDTAFTIDQQDSGDLLNFRSGGIDVFQVLNNGALNIISPDVSNFAGNIQLADGSGIYFGTETSGLSIYQDTHALGMNDLLISMRGDATANDFVNIGTEGGFGFSANEGIGGTGDDEPGLSMNSNGSVNFYNTRHGSPENRYLEMNFTNGVRMPEGNLTLVGGKIGVGTEDPQVAVDVVGSVQSSDLSGGGMIALSADANGKIIPETSDERLKKNIRKIDNALDTLLKLRGVRYEWKDAERFGDQTEIGFVAQELQPVLPEVVRDSGEYLSVNTRNIVAVVVEAMKELYAKVDDYFARTERLEREIVDLRAEVEILKQASNSNTSSNTGVMANPETPSSTDTATVTDTVPDVGTPDTTVSTDASVNVTLNPSEAQTTETDTTTQNVAQ